MTRSQLLTTAAFLLLLLFLQFGFRTKPVKVLELEQSRALNQTSTDISILKNEAFDELQSGDRSRIQILEAQIQEEDNPEAKLELLKNLSGTWYALGQSALAGNYAEEIAKEENTSEAWGIAGTTYAACVKSSTKEKEKSFCLQKAIESLEMASSLDPAAVNHTLNRAVLLAENPPSDNPMKGVLLLLDLNKKHPENVPVINNIAKFALQTGQLDRAEQRLLKANDLLPNNKTTNCLLAELYSAKGDISKAELFKEKCALQG